MTQQVNLKLKIKGETHDLVSLSKREMQLIYHIRNRFRFGDILVKVNNGEPYRILRTIEYETLTG